MKKRIFLILLFIATFISVLARYYDPLPGDITITLWLQDLNHPVMAALMRIASSIGSGASLFGFMAFIILCLSVIHRYRESLAAIVAVVLMGLNHFFKLIIDRPRPSMDLIAVRDIVSGLGFPSGHAYQSLIALGFVILLANIIIEKTWLRMSLQIFIVILIFTIGLSRIYLGVHWPSDVLGGYLLGGLLLVFLLTVFESSNTNMLFEKQSLAT